MRRAEWNFEKHQGRFRHREGSVGTITSVTVEISDFTQNPPGPGRECNGNFSPIEVSAYQLAARITSGWPTTHPELQQPAATCYAGL